MKKEDEEPYYPCQEFFAVLGFYPARDQHKDEDNDNEDVDDDKSLR